MLFPSLQQWTLLELDIEIIKQLENQFERESEIFLARCTSQHTYSLIMCYCRRNSVYDLYLIGMVPRMQRQDIKSDIPVIGYALL